MKALKYLILLIMGITIFWFIAPRNMCKPSRKQKETTCMTMLSIATSLKTYKQEKGFFPTTKEGLQVLIKLNYLNKIPRDGWHTKIIYLQDGQNFRLISLGVDRKEGGNHEGKDIFYQSCKKINLGI